MKRFRVKKIVYEIYSPFSEEVAEMYSDEEFIKAIKEGVDDEIVANKKIVVLNK